MLLPIQINHNGQYYSIYNNSVFKNILKGARYHKADNIYLYRGDLGH